MIYMRIGGVVVGANRVRPHVRYIGNGRTRFAPTKGPLVKGGWQRS